MEVHFVIHKIWSGASCEVRDNHEIHLNAAQYFDTGVILLKWMEVGARVHPIKAKLSARTMVYGEKKKHIFVKLFFWVRP